MERPTAYSPPRRIPLSRLVTGVLLHFCVPAYLLACLIAGFAVDPAVAHAGDIVPRMLWTGAWFLPAFALVTAVGAAIGRVIDARMPPPVPDDGTIAQAEAHGACRTLAAFGDKRIAGLAARLEANAWAFGDPADQQVASDLQSLARTFELALASAPPDRRAAVLDLGAASLQQLTEAAEQLSAARAKLDEGDAHTVARYISARYR